MGTAEGYVALEAAARALLGSSLRALCGPLAGLTPEGADAAAVAGGGPAGVGAAVARAVAAAVEEAEATAVACLMVACEWQADGGSCGMQLVHLPL